MVADFKERNTKLINSNSSCQTCQATASEALSGLVCRYVRFKAPSSLQGTDTGQ